MWGLNTQTVRSWTDRRRRLNWLDPPRCLIAFSRSLKTWEDLQCPWQNKKKNTDLLGQRPAFWKQNLTGLPETRSRVRYCGLDRGASWMSDGPMAPKGEKKTFSKTKQGEGKGHLMGQSSKFPVEWEFTWKKISCFIWPWPWRRPDPYPNLWSACTPNILCWPPSNVQGHVMAASF